MSKQETISLELTPVELGQLTLCIGHRIGGLMEQFANAPKLDDQKSYEGQMAFLERLNNKVKEKIIEVSKDGKGN